jgi:hypothetical protein
MTSTSAGITGVIEKDKDRSELISSSSSYIKKRVVECSTTAKPEQSKEEIEKTVDKSSRSASKVTS